MGSGNTYITRDVNYSNVVQGENINIDTHKVDKFKEFNSELKQLQDLIKNDMKISENDRNESLDKLIELEELYKNINNKDCEKEVKGIIRWLKGFASELPNAIELTTKLSLFISQAGKVFGL